LKLNLSIITKFVSATIEFHILNLTTDRNIEKEKENTYMDLIKGEVRYQI